MEIGVPLVPHPSLRVRCIIYVAIQTSQCNVSEISDTSRLYYIIIVESSWKHKLGEVTKDIERAANFAYHSSKNKERVNLTKKFLSFRENPFYFIAFTDAFLKLLYTIAITLLKFSMLIASCNALLTNYFPLNIWTLHRIFCHRQATRAALVIQNNYRNYRARPGSTSIRQQAVHQQAAHQAARKIQQFMRQSKIKLVSPYVCVYSAAFPVATMCTHISYVVETSC